MMQGTIDAPPLSDSEIIWSCRGLVANELLKRAKKDGDFKTSRFLQKIIDAQADKNLKIMILSWPDDTFCLIAIPISLRILPDAAVLAAYRFGRANRNQPIVFKPLEHLAGVG